MCDNIWFQMFFVTVLTGSETGPKFPLATRPVKQSGLWKFWPNQVLSPRVKNLSHPSPFSLGFESRGGYRAQLLVAWRGLCWRWAGPRGPGDGQRLPLRHGHLPGASAPHQPRGPWEPRWLRQSPSAAAVSQGEPREGLSSAGLT